MTYVGKVFGLTGDWRTRINYWGKLILQVEERCDLVTPLGGACDVEKGTRWRDARAQDLRFIRKETKE